MLNGVVISILVLIVLSLLRINVILALLAAAITAGLVSGLSLQETVETLVSGMGGQANTALSYILLGMFAAAVSMTGITELLVRRLLQFLKGKKGMLLLTIAAVASLSQNVVPVHIAFIPILIPPLLHLFDQLKIDRRGVASALTFGLKAPYIMVPAGYGLIFHGIIADEMTRNGMAVAVGDIPLAMLIPGLGMVVGLLVAIFFTYRRERGYASDSTNAWPGTPEQEEVHFSFRHGLTITAIIAAFGVQIVTQSLVLGALTGLTIMFVAGVVRLQDGDELANQGIRMMGMIAFVMLISSGYATILKETGAVDGLVAATAEVMGTNPLLIAIVFLAVGLLVTMGIGTSFGTVPILAALYVPLCTAAGFSPLATAALIGTAAAIGDAGSPVSDSTLGPTAGLNADGRHDHIWDTCVPTFIHYNIPLFIFGVIAALVL
ncbi:putative histidine transporter YuiF (NhaC family) [Caldalkalibacillus uzonensis]|uniref:Histidine transporter YuiF (NhaC family) n=1 Tax=Caldalkalibacillus uzonensis TaxID=353224 RepID=A0ABU0CUB9_9BACI|nr:Na+/H+ antiporter NhaC family protein [Caldalkalibacillus uzonensis]MDQ0340015.1 putative histidine transporter YuiF (NhaC family) [Caldalkalibacillus uzonensis]